MGAAEKVEMVFQEIICYADVTLLVSYTVSMILLKQNLSTARWLRYHTVLLKKPNVKVCVETPPYTNSGGEGRKLMCNCEKNGCVYANGIWLGSDRNSQDSFPLLCQTDTWVGPHVKRRDAQFDYLKLVKKGFTT